MKTVLRALLVPALILMCVCFYTLGLVVAQEVEPKLTLEQHDAIATLQSKDLQKIFQMQAYQKKYQDLLNNDPGFHQLSTEKDAIEKQLQEEMQKAMKGVDPKKWRLNTETLTFEPVTPQEKEKK